MCTLRMNINIYIAWHSGNTKVYNSYHQTHIYNPRLQNQLHCFIIKHFIIRCWVLSNSKTLGNNFINFLFLLFEINIRILKLILTSMGMREYSLRRKWSLESCITDFWQSFENRQNSPFFSLRTADDRIVSFGPLIFYYNCINTLWTVAADFDLALSVPLMFLIK